ncbi:T9SS type A sorting domain-containing protein [Chryseobacterium indologenes]|nr:T9SS type A sorting domain-containing protein [Chryseobacterium indologenes]
MKKLLLSCLMFLGIGASAQTVLISPTVNNGGFESGAASWTVVNGSQTNKWQFDTGATAGFSGANSAYISNSTSAPYAHAYTTTSTSTTFFYQDVTFPAGETDINLSFKLLVQGEGSSTRYDYLRVYLVPTSFTPVTTAVPSTTTYPNNWTINLKGDAWTNQLIPISASQAGNATANSTMRLIFMWRNDSGSGTQPPAAIDDITLTTNAITTPPQCTRVVAPVNGATGISRTPTITWNAVGGGVTSYKLNLGTTPGGTDIINGTDVGNVTSYAVPASAGLLYNTTYYATVVPVNAIGEATGCNPSSFTTLNIACPSVSSPSSDALNVSTTPAISWSAVSGATGYRISVGSTAGGTDIANNVDLGNVLTYTIPSTLNYNTTYYYTVNSYQGTNSSSASCTNRKFTTKFPPPANDDCANAVALTVNSDLNCAVKGTGNTLGATQSTSSGTCSGVTADDDVWYSFVATSATHVVKLSNVVSTGTSTTTDMYFQVLSGTCGAFTSVKCSDADVNLVSGLTPGQTYYIKVFTYDSGGQYAASFDICVGTLPPPPANDECANAISLTVNPDMNCGVVTSGTTLSATNSSVPVGSCSGNPDDDVWYSFTAVATTHTIWLKNVAATGTSTSTSLYAQVFSGDCGSLVNKTCISSNTNYTAVTGLTPGAVYYVRVYNSNANTTSTIYANTFDICVGTLPPPPANDECANAVSLVPSNSGMCSGPVAGTTMSASQSTGTTPGCSASGINDDVWYSFTATAATHMVNVNYSDNATATQVYSGACGSLVAVSCSSGEYGNSNVLLQNLTVGSVYYVRVYSTSASSGITSNFQICITSPSAVANDTCDTAIAIPCGGTVEGNNALAADETLPSVTCGSSGSTASYKGVWYTVTAQSAGSVTISACGAEFDAYLRVYSGSCGNFTCVGSADSGCTGSNIYNSPTYTFTATAGTTYYVLLSGYSATQFGKYTISVTQECSTMATSDVNKKDDKIKMYPNPFSDVVNISDVKNVKSVSVIDISGRVVKTIDNPSSALQLADLKQGMYLISLKMKDGSVQTIKTIKK